MGGGGGGGGGGGSFEGEDDKECVLKDVRVDTDRPREGDILRNLAHAFQLDPYPNSSFRDHFLTVIEDTIVELDGTHHDDTLNTMMNGQEPPKDCKSLNLPHPSDLPSKLKTRSVSHAVSSGIGPSPHDVKRAPILHHFRPRSHYRITFKEVGKALYEVKSLEDIFNALRDVMSGSRRSAKSLGPNFYLPFKRSGYCTTWDTFTVISALGIYCSSMVGAN